MNRNLAFRIVSLVSIFSMLLGAVGTPTLKALAAAGSKRVMCEVDSSLVGCWRMEEGSGTTLYDGGAEPYNDASLSGTPSPTFTTGKVGSYSLLLNGTSQYASVPYSSNFDMTANITLSAWIKPAKVATQDIIKKTSGSNGFELSISASTSSWPQKVFFRINASDATRVNSTTLYPIDSNTWMHIAATYDGVTMRLYINGTQEAYLATTNLIGANTSPLAIGAIPGGTSRWFQGGIDDARIYDRALRATEIAALASTTPPPPGDTTAPAAPTALTATPGNTTVSLTWTSPTAPDVKGYNIYRSTETPVVLTAPINGALVGTESYNDTGLTNGTPYYYVVTAVDTSGNISGASGEATATPAGDTNPPAAPTGLSATPGNKLVNLTWTANGEPDLAGYNLYRGTLTGGPYPTKVNSILIAGTSITDTGLANGTTYYYVLKAVDTFSNESAASSQAAATPAEANTALQFTTASGTYVTFGDPAKLDLATFTIETWFKRTDTGTPNTTGSGGITNAIPLVTHGSPQADGSNVDADWVLVINDTTKVIGADFEDMATGLNHPVSGVTTIANNVWYHAAATYDGTTWRLYLNGNLETTLVVGSYTPRSDSIQQAGLGTMIESGGTPHGYFQGIIDEARVWNVARTQAQIRADINSQLTAGTGLVARWGLNEGSGTTVGDSIATAANGTIMPLTGANYAWVAGAPFDISIPAAPAAPSGLTAVAPTYGQVHLTWIDNSNNETGFEVERSTAGIGGPFSLLATVEINAQAYDDPNRTPGQEYCYRVRAMSGAGQSSYAGPLCATTPAEGSFGLQLGSSSTFVKFPNASSLNTPTFTVETWFRRDGAGTADTTGTNGTNLIPLIAKGTAEEETADADINYIMGINPTNTPIANVLCADFEEARTGTSPGLNHPVCGTTAIVTGTWYHAAATYDGNTWRLYLNGQPEATLAVGQLPNAANMAPVALGTGLQTNGTTAQGHFDGTLDEVRIWNVARTQAEIMSTINSHITNPQTGLLARWGLNEGSGALVNGLANAPVYGTIVGSGYSWPSPGAPFNITPPTLYDLSVTTSGNGSVTLNPPGGIYNNNTLVQLTAVPDSGWVFSGWSGDLSGSANPITITMNSHKTVTATFGESNQVMVTFQDGVAGYTGTIDSYLYAGNPTGSYGGSDVLEWDTSGTLTPYPAGMMYGLIRFNDIFGSAPGQVPVGASIVSAELIYTVSDIGDPANMYEVATNWDESTTFDTFGGDPDVQTDEYRTPVIGIANGNSAGTTVIDVTASLNAWSAAPANNYGWIFIPTNLNGVQVRSSEFSTIPDRPHLQVTYATNEPLNHAPGQPTLVQPASGATGVSTSPSLAVTVTDPDSDNMTVTFYGRPFSSIPGPDFTIVALPDTQNYTAALNGGSPALFNGQTGWIVANQLSDNIVYVTQLGDITNDGDTSGKESEWSNATQAMYALEPNNIPYGITLGNHDQIAGTIQYNTYFGSAHFNGRPYYGGHYGTDNNNHYDLFSASGLDFIVVSLNCGTTPTTEVLNWASNLLASNLDRRAIISCHDLINTGDPAPFSTTGQAVYNALKGNPNLFLMLGGHNAGEGFRQDNYNGNTVYSLLSDYQSRPSGGDGWLRVMRFSPQDNKIYIETYSPWLTQYETDANSQFMLNYNMGSSSFQVIGTVTGVASGTSASVNWSDLQGATQYEWYATVNDGKATTTGPSWDFTTQQPPHPPVITEGVETTVPMSEDAPASFNLTLHATDANVGDTLTWSIFNPATHGTASASGTGDSKVIGYAPNADYNGSDSFVVRVVDGYGGSDTITVNVTIQAVNDNPTLTNPGAQTNAENNVISLQVLASDVDVPAQTLTYSATNLPGGLSINTSTGLISGTVSATASVNSPYNVTLGVNDGNGGSDSASFTWTITQTTTQPGDLTCTTIQPKPMTASTGEKPQSKVWNYNGAWYAVFPTDASGASSAGTWLWKLVGSTWNEVLKLSSATNTKADVKTIGNLAHILLYNDPSTQLASVEFTGGTYQPWSLRPTLTSISLPGSEIATIDVDSTGRMWLATRQDSPSPAKIVVYYSDSPYTSFQGPVEIASGVMVGDDISAVTAMAGNKIGVLWSNQNSKRFGFRVHIDGSDPTAWSADELPASQSAIDNVGTGMADDHLNIKVASDGTLYAAVKTGYDTGGYPKMALLVRRPSGTWDNLYSVDEAGTRGNIELDEERGILTFVFTQSEGNNPIVYRQSNLSPISFGAKKILRTESFNDVTSTKQNYTNELVILYSNGTQVGGQLCTAAPTTGADLSITKNDGRLTIRPNETTVYTIAVSNSGPQAVAGATVSDTLPASLGSATWTCTGTGGGTCTASGSGSLTDTVNLPVGSSVTYTLTAIVGLGARGTVTNTAAVSTPGGITDPNPANNSATDTDTIVTGGVSCGDDPTLVGCWQMEEGSGTVLIDGSSYSNDGNLLGSPAPTWTTGKIGSYALDFDGSTGYVNVPDDSSLNITTNITMAAWIKPEKIATQDLIKKAGSSAGYEFSLATISGSTTPQQVFVRFNQNDSYRIGSMLTYPIDGTWIHAAVTYDGSIIRIYINGYETNSKVISFTIAANTVPLTLGADSSGSRKYQGYIDDARVYNRTLSSDEIKVLAGVSHTLNVSITGSGSGAVTSDPAGIVCGATCSADYLHNTLVTLTAAPGVGSTFTGWNGACTGTGTCQVTMNAAKDVTANFALNTFTLTYTAGTGGTIEGATPQTVNYGEAGTPVTAVPNVGYHFVIWSDGVLTASRTDTNVMANLAVTANYSQDEYTLTINIVGNGTVNRDMSGPYHYGAMVQLTAVPDAGWSFGSWSANVVGGSVTINGNTTVTATFTQDEYTLTVNVVGSGSVTRIPDLATYHYGTEVQLTAVPDTGWSFGGWSGDAMGIANPVSVTMNGNKTVTASYSAIEYILTVNVIGNGTVAKSPDQASYIYGDVVQLTATPAAGWSFANWSDDLYGNTNPGSITIDGNKTVTANFTENFAPNPPIGLKAWLTSVSINLDWDDSIDPNLAGYNVYRGEEGTYVKLNSSLLAASFYQDLSTTYNVTYDYQVTVVNLAGLESNPATVSTKRVIAYRSASSAANKVASSLTIPTPANIQPNDFLFAAISVQGAPTITAPSGWIKIRNDATGDNTLRQALYYKLVTAGEPPSFTWSFSSRQGASGGIVAYVGIDPINPIGASSGQANSTSSSYIAPSVTISARTELLVGFFGIASNPIVTQPGGMLEQAEIAMASGKSKVVTEIADEILMNLTGNVIDSGTRTASGDKAAVSIGQLVALLPANSGPAPDIQAPSVPVNLSATAVSPNQVDLTWTPSTDNVAVTGYGVYRDGTKIGTTTVAHYSDTTVSQDQTYIYQVDAYDAAPNYSGLSSQVSVSTPHLSQGIQFVGASMGATQGSKTTLLINRPLGAVSGDLLLATIDIRDGSTINPPPNWTKFIETNNGTSLTKITYYKVMGAGEPGSYVWTFSAPEVATGIILAYSGVDPNSPIEASAGVANSSGISLTAPPVSSSSQNSVLVTFYGLATSASITPQSSMTERAEVFGTSGKIKITSEAADEWLTSGNATGTRVATASKAEVSIGHSIVLKPAGP